MSELFQNLEKIRLFLSLKIERTGPIQFLEMIRLIESTKFHHHCKRTQLVVMLIVKIKFTNAFEQRNPFSNNSAA